MAKVLTARAVEAAKPDPSGKRLHIPDGGQTGLYLIVQPSGVKSWAVWYRVGSRQRKFTIGRYPGVTLKTAREAAQAVLRKASEGADPATEKKRAKRDEGDARDLFENVANEWLKRDQAKNRTHGEVKRSVDRELLPKWKGRPIASITRRDVMDLLDGIADRGSPVQSRRVHAYLHRLFRWSVGRGIVDVNPVADLPKHGTETRRDRVLTDAELALVWQAAKDTDARFGPVFQLLILTGARREEIGALRWSEIDGDTIRLEGERTKNGEPHNIALSSEALAIIEAAPRVEAIDDDGHSRPSPFAFTTTGHTPVSGWTKAKAALDAKITELNDGEPLPYWRLHDFRRTVATGLQRLGIGLQVIEAVLNHVSGSRAGIVGVYQRHAYEDEKRAALDAWGRYVSLLSDAKLWAAVSARLNAGDRDETLRARRRFNAAILDGGRTWSAYLAAVQAEGAKVVQLRQQALDVRNSTHNT